MRRHKKWPHEGVYTKLMPSPIDGVGVFAIRRIPSGIYPFGKLSQYEGDCYVPDEIVKAQGPEIRKLYQDFAILDGRGRWWFIDSFNLMTTAFYLNHCKRPNMAIDGEREFYAIRDIEVAEELTVDYDTYSKQGV